MKNTETKKGYKETNAKLHQFKLFNPNPPWRNVSGYSGKF